MHRLLLRFPSRCVVSAGLAAAVSLVAQTSTGAAAAAATASPAAASPASIDQHTLDKRTKPVLKELGLKGEKADTVRRVLEQHLQAVKAWHDVTDATLSALWTDWAAARTPPHKDEAKAGEIAKRIDEVYAGFKPQHDAFLAALAKELSPEQVEKVKNALTKSPGLERTYNAYLQMIPNFTEAQKAFIHQKLEVARDQSIDAATDKEKASLFKKQKVQVEAYIDQQGLDYKKAYKAYVERLNAGQKKED